MFISQNQLVSEIQRISRIGVSVNGVPADSHDVSQFQTVTLLRYGLEADLSGFDCISKCSYRRAVNSQSSVDLRWLAEDYKVAKSSYLQWIQRNQSLAPWSSFKRSIAGRIQNKWILTTLANFYGSPRAFLQWTSFDERLLLTTPLDLKPEIDAYLSQEQSLSNLVYSDSVLDPLSDIIGEWFSAFSFAEGPVRFQFGPGAVAEWKGRLPILEKAKRLIYDSRTVDDLSEFWAIDARDMIPGRPGDASRVNRIIFRPKNALKHRIISAEPCWLTWLQQGIKNPLYDYVEARRDMFTWFSDQSRSRELALEGSIAGKYATVDFSNASDSVTAALVDRLFSQTCLHDPLLLTRSCIAEMPDGRLCWLHKFAPMGSATCFATMDIILLSICELAIRQTFGRHGLTSDYVVYGDDVVIRSEAVPAFYALTQGLGFQVNRDKSYSDSETPHFYRESCGIEAYDGENITPFRYSRFQEPLIWEDPSDAEWVSSAVAMMNRLQLDYAYYSVRSVAWELINYSLALTAGRLRRLACRVWSTLPRIDETDARRGLAGPDAIVTPDGTATNYHCVVASGFDVSGGCPVYHRKTYRISRHVSRTADPHGETDDDLFLLWCFLADAERPSARATREGSLVSTAAGLVDQRWSYEWWVP